MPYHKFQADYLFTGTELLDHSRVLITDENGKIEDIVSSADAGDNIRKLKGLLSPGFINCHCHLELSHMKGLLPEKTGLVNFVFNIVTHRHFPEEEILQAITQAEDDMMTNGIVAVGDICNNTLTFSRKLKQRMDYYNFIEVSGWLPVIAAQRFQAGKNYYETFCRLSRQQVSISPHAPYSVSDELWQLLTPGFQNKTITIHNQETAFEDDLFKYGTGDFIRMYKMMKIDHSFFRPTGKSSLQSYLNKLTEAKNVLLVHNTFIKEEDITAVKFHSLQQGTQFFFCLCVRANSFIENAIPPVELLRREKAKITIGTDSLASNWGLSILDEVKTIKKEFPIIPTFELLQWATINGARALQMDNRLGSFEKNKQPGIVLIESLEDEEITMASTVKRLL